MSFAAHWQAVGRTDQVEKPGITSPRRCRRRADRRGARRRWNIARVLQRVPASRHDGGERTSGHAAAIRCPYHGWTYDLEGELSGMPEFDGVCQFDRAQNGLVPIACEHLGEFCFREPGSACRAAARTLGALVGLAKPLNFGGLQFVERRSYDTAIATGRCTSITSWTAVITCRIMHKGLNSVLEYTNYTIENRGPLLRTVQSRWRWTRAPMPAPRHAQGRSMPTISGSIRISC